MDFRMVGDHPEDLADGRPIARGEKVSLTKDQLRQDHNENLIADGKLIPIDDKAQTEADLAIRRAEARYEGSQTTTTAGGEG